METKIIATYRGWLLTVTDHDGIAERADGSGETLERHRQVDAEAALRAVKAGVNLREGPQVWDENYTNEALR